LRKDVHGKHGSDSEAEEIDTSLSAKCKFTSDILHQVATALGAMEQKLGSVGSGSEGAASLVQQLDAWQAKHAKLVNERAAMEARMIRYRQSRNEATIQMETLEEALDKERISVKKMANRLEDAERQSKSDSKTVAAAGGATGSEVDKEERDAMLIDAEKNAEMRLNETNVLREQLASLQEEALKLKQQVVAPADASIIQSAIYRALAFEYKALDTNHTKVLENVERLQQENTAAEVASQEEANKMHVATLAARTELSAKLQAAEDRAKTANERYEEARQSLNLHGLQPNRQQQVAELNLLVASLRQELARAKKVRLAFSAVGDDVVRLSYFSSAYQHDQDLKERPKETAAELKEAELRLAVKVEASDSKISRLTKDKSKATEELADAKKREKEWAEKEKEYKILLDVFKSSSKDVPPPPPPRAAATLAHIRNTHWIAQHKDVLCRDVRSRSCGRRRKHWLRLWPTLKLNWQRCVDYLSC
jgi:hypothetical protein